MYLPLAFYFKLTWSCTLESVGQILFVLKQNVVLLALGLAPQK